MCARLLCAFCFFVSVLCSLFLFSPSFLFSSSFLVFLLAVSPSFFFRSCPLNLVCFLSFSLAP
jgi:hypothetical protein